MNRVIALAIGWVLCIGLWLLLQTTYNPVPTAAKIELALTAKAALATNHLLQTGDVDVAGVSNRYLTKPVAQGKPVLAQDTSPEPSVGPRLSLYTASVELGLIRDGTVNAGRKVLVCDGATKIDEAIVVTLLCARPLDGSCVALLGPGDGKSKFPASLPEHVSVGGKTCK